MPRSWSVGFAGVSRARGQDAGYRLVTTWGAIRRCSGRGHLDGDKQCYVVGHIYVSSHASSADDSCPAAGASQSRMLGDLGDYWTECLSALFHGLLHELVMVF